MQGETPVEGLRVEQAGPVATIWLDRPAKRNAVHREMWLAIADVCGRLAGDPAVRLLLVQGAGDHFCAGADIGSGDDVTSPQYQAATAAADEALAAFPKPTVAVVRGVCVGGGAQIAVACDLRLADTTSRFGITPARLGIVYPPGATRRVVDLIGPSATKHLLFTAEIVDATRALRIGLIDELHDPSELAHRVDALTQLLTSERSLLTQMASKAMVDDVVATGAVSPETETRWRIEVAGSPDAAEGMAAFAERRAPRFAWTPPADA